MTESSLSDWLDKNIYLSSEVSPEPGFWNTARTPYLREPFEAVLDPDVKEVVFKTASQVGKSSFVNNVIAYYSVVEPSPIMLMLPTIELARTYSTTRLDTLIRDSPVLNRVFSSHVGNTNLHKTFAGGHLIIVGANSPVMLSSTPIRVLLADEVDRFPRSAGGEGDPLQLAKKRTNNFIDRKIIITSTPTVKGDSTIEDSYELSDQRKHYLPCLHCGAYQVLEWKYVIWEAGRPETAHYTCAECGVVIEDSEKDEMLAKGKWKASVPFFGRAGFFLSELYSPWRTFGEIAAAFLECKGKPEKLRTFVNTSLGETFEEVGDRIDFEDLASRVEVYNAEVPAKVLTLVCGVDVQLDRFELEVVGFGDDEENWSIDYKVIHCDTSLPKSYEELYVYLTRDFTQEYNDNPIKIDATCVDSSNLTSTVYDFINSVKGQRIFAVKGSSKYSQPVVSGPVRSSINRTSLYMIGTDTAKDMIYARFRLGPGPGYSHFPNDRSQEYFKQLTSEHVITKYIRGYKQRQYVQKYERNEALDCRVYAVAALTIFNPDWKYLRKRRYGEKLVEVQIDEAAPLKRGINPFPSRKSGYVSKYRTRY